MASATAGLPTEARIVEAARRYHARLPADHVFCGITALAIHGVDLPARLSAEQLHVNGPLDRARPVIPGVIGHRFSDVQSFEVDGLRVVSVVQAWVQAAPRLTIDELVEVGDAIVRRKNPLATIQDLVVAAAAAGRRPGANRLREAIRWVRPRTDAPPETRLRLLIIRAGFPEPEVNAPIRDASGHVLGHGDLVYSPWRIDIEHDGEYHFATPEQGRHDLDRQASFVRAGWLPLHAHRGTFIRPKLFLDDLARAIHSRS